MSKEKQTAVELIQFMSAIEELEGTLKDEHRETIESFLKQTSEMQKEIDELKEKNNLLIDDLKTGTGQFCDIALKYTNIKQSADEMAENILLHNGTKNSIDILFKSAENYKKLT